MRITASLRRALPAAVAAALLAAALPASARHDDYGSRDASWLPDRVVSFDNHYGRGVRFEIAVESRDGRLALRAGNGIAPSYRYGTVWPGQSVSACVAQARACDDVALDGNLRIAVFDIRTGRCLDRRYERVRLERPSSGRDGRDDWHRNDGYRHDRDDRDRGRGNHRGWSRDDRDWRSDRGSCR